MELSNSAVKTPDAESESPTRIQPAKPPPSPNGVLKRHTPLHLHHGHPVVLKYQECLKNHAATLGGHALDGCGEFMQSPASNPADPTSLKCAACGCHRNFHRREPEEPFLPNAALALEYRPVHRHHPPPPHSGSPDNSPSPPPISSSYYPSAPHMLLALSQGLAAPPADGNIAGINASSPNSRKRFRTKFTQNQKEKMLEFAAKVEWKIQKKDEDLISGFCSEIGVEKGVLKVWMHNNKNNFGKKDQLSNCATTLSSPPSAINNDGGMSYTATATAADTKQNGQLQELHHYHHHDDSIIGSNESSSS